MFTIKKYVVADSLEEAYKLNQSKKANIKLKKMMNILK